MPHGTEKREADTDSEAQRCRQSTPATHHEESALDQTPEKALTAKSPIPNGLQPFGMRQSVLILLAYVQKHGYRVSYELWEDSTVLVLRVRPAGKLPR